MSCPLSFHPSLSLTCSLAEGRKKEHKGGGVQGSSSPERVGGLQSCMASRDIVAVNLHNGCHLAYVSETNSLVRYVFRWPNLGFSYTRMEYFGSL